MARFKTQARRATGATGLTQEGGDEGKKLARALIAHSREQINAELQKQFRQINEHPVLHQQIIFASPKIHHAHTDAFAGCWCAQVFAKMRRAHGGPPGGRDEMPFGETRLVGATVGMREPFAIRERSEEGRLVIAFVLGAIT